MAIDINNIRAWNAQILNVNTDPSVAPGISSGVTSLAIGPSGIIYRKTGKLDTDWDEVTNFSGAKTIFVLDNGEFSTAQEAIDQAQPNDCLVFGPKEVLSWGAITLPAEKSLSLIALSTPRSKNVKIGPITFSPSTGANPNASEIYIANFFIEDTVTYSGTAPSRLRVSNCYLYKKNFSPCVVADNSGALSSIYLENCLVQADHSASNAIEFGNLYARIYYSIVEGGIKGLNINSGITEVYSSQFNTDNAGDIVAISSTGNLLMSNSLVRNQTANGSGVSVAAGGNFSDTSNTYAIAAGSGYCISGSGVVFQGQLTTTNSLATPQNVNIQNTLTVLPYTTTLTPVP